MKWVIQAVLIICLIAAVAYLFYGISADWRTVYRCTDVSHSPYRYCSWEEPGWRLFEKVNPKRNIILFATVIGLTISLILTGVHEDATIREVKQKGEYRD